MLVAPCFLALSFVRRVHSQTFEGGNAIGTPHFLASEWVIGILIDRVIYRHAARDAGARVININIRLSGLHVNPAS